MGRFVLYIPERFFLINNSLAVILVEPQLGENIGFIARSMKNFSLNELRIVNPRDGWPNHKAVSASVGACNIINDAKIYNSINDAISDIHYLYATTANERDVNKDFIPSYSLAEELSNNAGKIGLMFGRENSGLTNQEISLANKVITIDTDQSLKSLNISHAACLIFYEIFKKFSFEKQNIIKNNIITKGDLDNFYKILFTKLDEGKFFKVKEKESLIKRKITNIFSRIDKISKTEIQILHGIINSLSEQ